MLNLGPLWSQTQRPIIVRKGLAPIAMTCERIGQSRVGIGIVGPLVDSLSQDDESSGDVALRKPYLAMLHVRKRQRWRLPFRFTKPVLRRRSICRSGCDPPDAAG